ncbi:hypothetical protein KC19_3G186200 [Ceratodon purpureus]|uniref:Uncharacterized protein n=1 Tax=Ceratodon purpureus TaxID=3225 RepID=A0A8T0IM66_CERPU|nr:hypothetical protein KC19_3G186200 [Ceratodon purpureus]
MLGGTFIDTRKVTIYGLKFATACVKRLSKAMRFTGMRLLRRLTSRCLFLLHALQKLPLNLHHLILHLPKLPPPPGPIDTQTSEGHHVRGPHVRIRPRVLRRPLPLLLTPLQKPPRLHITPNLHALFPRHR